MVRAKGAVFLLAILAVTSTTFSYAQINPVYIRSTRSLHDNPPTRSNPRLEEVSSYVGRSDSANCAVESPVFEMQHEGRERSFQHLDSPRFYEDRYFLPVTAIRSKKAQKAILLDVGDYVIKGNGPPMVEASIPARSPVGGVGGILRSSGK